jgi:GNAT superfamily N-acetyltransferase
MRSRPVTIRSVTEEDWREYRGLRLRMLEDTPIAFGETLENALRLPEAEWRMRGRRGQEPRSALFVAIDEATMEWVGTMGGYVPPTGAPLLVGVFVAPEYRGAAAGVADRLLTAVVDWAGDYGTELALHVHEDNPRAVRYYERHGFVDTGRRLIYELPPGGRELEMVRPLG